MHTIISFSDLIGKSLIIYGAGYTGHYLHAMLTQKVAGIDVSAFCDTFQTGCDSVTGLNIIKPEELSGYPDAVILIGLSDFVKEDTVKEIERTLMDSGIVSGRVLRYSQFIRLFGAHTSESFEWQCFQDDLYDFDVNLPLIRDLAIHIVPGDSSVVDLGAGGMNLRKLIPQHTAYFPVDFKRRCNETVVCDFNKREFPDINADVYVLCAMLYYIEDPTWLLEKVASFASKKIIVALNDKSLAGNPEAMQAGGFKNYMYFDDISELLARHGFAPVKDVTIKDIARRYVVYNKNL